jgi:hypothetical protein
MLAGATSVQPPVQPRCYPVQRRCVPPPYTPGAWHARTHLWVLRACGRTQKRKYHGHRPSWDWPDEAQAVDGTFACEPVGLLGTGHTAEVKHLPQLASALAKATAKARELGLIENDAEGEQ